VVHSFRNTCSTLMIRAGANPKVVQEHMRHSTIDLTMITYTRSTEDDQNKAVTDLYKLISGSEECAEGVLTAVAGGEDDLGNPEENKGLRLVSFGAEGGIRTPTPLRALDPEPSASANSATSAQKEAKI
jgi:hypothetical protein